MTPLRLKRPRPWVGGNFCPWIHRADDHHPTATAQTAVTTYHNDNYRTGWNSTETVLTPANVSQQFFRPAGHGSGGR